MSQSIVLWEITESSMVDTWTTSIVCTRRKDGSFSLRPRKVSDDGLVTSPAGFSRIRAPDQFVAKLREIFELISYDYEDADFSEVGKNLARLDPSFAARMESLLGSPTDRARIPD
jgi:hypothetical protein